MNQLSKEKFKMNQEKITKIANLEIILNNLKKLHIEERMIKYKIDIEENKLNIEKNSIKNWINSLNISDQEKQLFRIEMDVESANNNQFLKTCKPDNSKFMKIGQNRIMSKNQLNIVNRYKNPEQCILEGESESTDINDFTKFDLDNKNRKLLFKKNSENHLLSNVISIESDDRLLHEEERTIKSNLNYFEEDIKAELYNEEVKETLHEDCNDLIEIVVDENENKEEINVALKIKKEKFVEIIIEEECDKDINNIKNEMNLKTKKEEKLNCNICGKSFKHNSYLTRHQKIHLLNRFRCEICDKIFSTNNTKKMHIQRIHKFAPVIKLYKILPKTTK